ncbi:hypothetical protein G1H11_12870 [Phytoactinopolyspora alkaliphila]|uniref:Uncharacterized protein n=1 Tax=Phytoactinopolyspora alkaliphila TaxID=1783498 RepID=A0A6N9YMI3_9ACTN|nr:hypothetical protein [Phytoactinopolyspora alkaliphila]NED96203.1 hypothetical protein [Phytoactinopolyspora alkaliphila]
MASRDKRDEQRLDQVDRRSQVSVSRALRARDASRPDPAAIAEALDKLKFSGMQRFRPTETPGRTGPDVRNSSAQDTPGASSPAGPDGPAAENAAHPIPRPPTQEAPTPAPPTQEAEAAHPTPRTE